MAFETDAEKAARAIAAAKMNLRLAAGHTALKDFKVNTPDIRLNSAHITILKQRLDRDELAIDVDELAPPRKAVFQVRRYSDDSKSWIEPTVVFIRPMFFKLDNVHGKLTGFHEMCHYMQWFSGQYSHTDAQNREVSAFIGAALWHQLVYGKPYSSDGNAEVSQSLLDEARRLAFLQIEKGELSKTMVADLRRMIQAHY